MEQQLQNEEQQRQNRRMKKIEQMKQEKARQEMLRKKIRQYAPIGAGAALCLVVGVVAISSAFMGEKSEAAELARAEGTQISTGILGGDGQEDGNDTEGLAELINDNEEMDEQSSEVAGNESDEIGQTSAGNEGDETSRFLEGSVGDEELGDEADVVAQMVSAGDVKLQAGYEAVETNATRWPNEEQILSTYAILVDASDNTIVTAKNAKTRISPASMTKILTVLVAADYITEADLDDTFTMTVDITDYAYVNDCSSVGFLDGEVVTVRDLLYGTILPSGGDAAVGLATYVAGSHEAFVELMNEKLVELGLSGSAHMTNCVGLYDKEHYCTVYDMAMILKAAVENDLCREVLSAHKYTTKATPQHEEGITVSNWFLRRIEDKETGGEVLCAKTGYVLQSGSCAASYEITDEGVPYICVTADTYSSWRCIYDHVAMYSLYAE